MGDVSDCLVSTSLLKKLSSDGYEIDCVSNEVGCQIFDFCPNCKTNLLSNFIPSVNYDKAINASAGVLGSSLMECVNANEKYGYGRKDNELFFYNEGAEKHYNSIFMKRPTQSNYFQLLYGIAELSWKGEGYSFKYFPKNRCRKTLTGVAIKHPELSELIMNNLKLEQSRLWRIPFRQNIFKMFDEINRCKRIVTDNENVLHISCTLRKKVEYIATKESPYKIEMFNSGNIHKYTDTINENVI